MNSKEPLKIARNLLRESASYKIPQEFLRDNSDDTGHQGKEHGYRKDDQAQDQFGKKVYMLKEPSQQYTTHESMVNGLAIKEADTIHSNFDKDLHYSDSYSRKMVHYHSIRLKNDPKQLLKPGQNQEQANTLKRSLLQDRVDQLEQEKRTMKQKMRGLLEELSNSRYGSNSDSLQFSIKESMRIEQLNFYSNVQKQYTTLIKNQIEPFFEPFKNRPFFIVEVLQEIFFYIRELIFQQIQTRVEQFAGILKLQADENLNHEFKGLMRRLGANSMRLEQRNSQKLVEDISELIRGCQLQDAGQLHRGLSETESYFVNYADEQLFSSDSQKLKKICLELYNCIFQMMMLEPAIKLRVQSTKPIEVTEMDLLSRRMLVIGNSLGTNKPDQKTIESSVFIQLLPEIDDYAFRAENLLDFDFGFPQLVVELSSEQNQSNNRSKTKSQVRFETLNDQEESETEDGLELLNLRRETKSRGKYSSSLKHTQVHKNLSFEFEDQHSTQKLELVSQHEEAKQLGRTLAIEFDKKDFNGTFGTKNTIKSQLQGSLRKNMIGKRQGEINNTENYDSIVPYTSKSPVMTILSESSKNTPNSGKNQKKNDSVQENVSLKNLEKEDDFLMKDSRHIRLSMDNKESLQSINLSRITRVEQSKMEQSKFTVPNSSPNGSPVHDLDKSKANDKQLYSPNNFILKQVPQLNLQDSTSSRKNPQKTYISNDNPQRIVDQMQHRNNILDDPSSTSKGKSNLHGNTKSKYDQYVSRVFQTQENHRNNSRSWKNSRDLSEYPDEYETLKDKLLLKIRYNHLD